MYLHTYGATERARPPCPGALGPRTSTPAGCIVVSAGRQSAHPPGAHEPSRPRPILLSLMLLALSVAPVRAQDLHDGLLMPRQSLGTGLLYAYDRWDKYWEGDLKRSNENIGVLTTRSITVAGSYGVTERLSVLAMLPYVWTHATRGTLHDMQGLQDLTLAAKYKLLATSLPERGTVDAIVVGAASLPVGDYSPDFLPLSIGAGSQQLSARFTLKLQGDAGWFMDGSTAYTWRAKVKLDRPAYYTDGRLYLSDDVALPEVLDHTLSAGYRKGRLSVPISVTRYRTLGGGDIRRQDMPFVANRMDFVRVGGAVGYTLPETSLTIRLGAARVVSGRNVGQAVTLTSGIHYTSPFQPGEQQ